MAHSERQSWQDLTTGAQSATILGAGLQLALLGSALWDITHRPETAIRGRRSLWTAALFVNFIGPTAYFLWGRRRTRVPGVGSG